MNAEQINELSTQLNNTSKELVRLHEEIARLRKENEELKKSQRPKAEEETEYSCDNCGHQFKNEEEWAGCCDEHSCFNCECDCSDCALGADLDPDSFGAVPVIRDGDE
jgi:hypothetical protein